MDIDMDLANVGYKDIRLPIHGLLVGEGLSLYTIYGVDIYSK